MNEFGIFRRRHMPHWDVEGHPVFITGCLCGSLPATGLKRIREYREKLEQRKRPDKFTPEDWLHHLEKLVFAFVDQLLDHESPVKHLQDDDQAKVVQDAFLHFAGERYKLFAFVVMPMATSDSMDRNGTRRHRLMLWPTTAESKLTF